MLVLAASTLNRRVGAVASRHRARQARRWGHLGAERERLDRVVREWMERHGEPWELAVGCRLEE